MPVNNALKPVKSRLPGLDYLRGLSAFGIMTYHYSSWNFGEQSANSFLGRVGIYGVAIFYILSGLTLSYIYSSKLQLKSDDLGDFYKKRLFRIFPLLWLATLLSILLSKHIPNIIDVILNLTGLFGLVKWDTYFATGAWSIGNELCFYLTFPLLVFLLSKSRIGLAFFIILACASYSYFAFEAMKPNVPLSTQWHTYTNPLNQFLFFLGGVVLGKFIQPTDSETFQRVTLGIVALTAFILFPVSDNTLDLVIGTNRLVFTGICFLLCYCFFSTAHAPTFIDKPLSLLGKVSYSLYLLHPLVYAVTKAAALVAARRIAVPSIYVMLVSMALSVVASYFSYHYFERFFIRISHRRSAYPIIPNN